MHTHNSSVVGLWREDLAKTNAKAAQSLADPTEYENLFPELKQALQAEDYLKSERATLLPAASYTSTPVSTCICAYFTAYMYIYIHMCVRYRTSVNCMTGC